MTRKKDTKLYEKYLNSKAAHDEMMLFDQSCRTEPLRVVTLQSLLVSRLFCVEFYGSSSQAP